MRGAALGARGPIWPGGPAPARRRQGTRPRRRHFGEALARAAKSCLVYMHPTLEPAMSVQTAIRLPEDLHQRFVALSRKTGRTAAFYMREALQRHIADLEDAFRADELIERNERGEEQILSSEEMWRGLDA